MKKCTKWRIANFIFWLIGGCTLIGMVLKAWYDLGCGYESLAAALALYGLFCFMFWGLIDEKIRNGFKNDKDHFEYR